MAVGSAASTGTARSASLLDGLRVVGGRQRRPAGMREFDGRWYGYGQGVIVEIDGASTGPGGGQPTARSIVEYTSAPGTCGPDDPVLFKSSTLDGDRLYATTQTEVVVLGWPDLDPVAHLSHPVFNDVHHAIPGDPAPDGRDTVLVAVSGQDAVAWMALDGELLDLWSVTDDRTSPAIDPGRDYRIDCNLKPHAIHPNYLFRLDDGDTGVGGDDNRPRSGAGGDVWVTRFESRDAVPLHDRTRRIAIDRERCHDGVVHDRRIWFTTVDGHVVEVDADTLAVTGEHSLARPGADTLLGWCRGLAFVDDDHLAVGFSRIRHTRFRHTLSWVRNGLTRSEPTRVALYDRRTWELVDECDLEPAGCNAVFSILPAGASVGDPS